MDMKVLPEHILIRLSPNDRTAIGQSTKEESKMKGEAIAEKELQKLIYLELLRRGLFFHYSRMDKKSRSRLGTPDFALPIRGEYVAIECKTETGKTTFEQNQVAEQIHQQRGLYYVVRSFDQFLNVIKSYGL